MKGDRCNFAHGEKELSKNPIQIGKKIRVKNINPYSLTRIQSFQD